MVPYIYKTEFDAKNGNLFLEGGIFRYRLQSIIHFDEKAPGWVRYRIIGGHFIGMEGNILFESRGEQGTLVAFDGEIQGSGFPPRFILEKKGAEIVFGYTTSKMRSFVENKKNQQPHDQTSSSTPRPERRILK